MADKVLWGDFFTKHPIFSKMFDISNLLSISRQLQSVVGMLMGAIQGQDLPEDAPQSIKGIAGFFGFKDERSMLVAMREFQRRSPEEFRIFVLFLNWTYAQIEALKPKLGKAGVAFYKIWYANRIRVLITGMPVREGRELGKTTDVDYKLSNRGRRIGETTTETNRRGPGYDGRIEGLRFIAKTVQANYDKLTTVADEDTRWQEAYNMTSEQLEIVIGRVPHVDDLPNLAEFWEKIKAKPGAALDTYINAVKVKPNATKPGLFRRRKVR